MTATTTRLRMSEWRLINIMYVRRETRSADLPMWGSDVDADIVAIRGLACHRLIRGVDLDGNSVDIPGLKANDLRRVGLGLTPAGVDWVTGNPQNVALRLIKGRGRAGAPVPDLLRHADAAVLEPLWRAGLFVLKDENGEVSSKSFGEVAAFGHGRCWPGLRAVIASKGRYLVDVI